VVQEFALVNSITATDKPYPHTQLLLQNPLLNVYNRDTATVNANVGIASAGSSVSEIMGSGSAATPNQNFTLRQSPLTYVQATTPTGRQSTLQVTANQVKWTEVQTLYQQGPSKTVFATLNQSDSTTDVLFGDGVEGATLPTGQNNIQATYRVGSGLAGNVAAGAITTLIDRPLGVSGVVNPQAATGGQDPQYVNDIRANAPLSVLTLGRAVSITDYQNFAATYAGIAKANAIWIPSGPGRGVFLTVAAAGGVALPPGNLTLGKLASSLRAYGNPLIPLNPFTFLETLFSLSADLAYDPAYDQPTVKSAVQAALVQNYSFANRTFGQGVSADEVAALIQAVPGVIAVNVTSLAVGPTSSAGDITGGAWSLAAYSNWLAQPVTLTRPSSGSPTRICPYLPVASSTGLPQPAEILVLDPDPNAVTLGVMS
jgi:predicted phage baseplate assembly protein